MREVYTENEPLHDQGASSSKGNQAKWNIDNYWYKADQFGYEGLSEVICSNLLAHTNYSDQITMYDFVKIHALNKIFQGCISKEFKNDNEMLIPLERLHRTHTGSSLSKTFAKFQDIKDRIKYTVDFAENVTGIINFGEYLVVMLEMDAFFLNEDRHLNNISLLYNYETGNYRVAPYYDMGLACFSDTTEEFTIEMDYFACREKIKAKPFSLDFDEQLDAANSLYGDFLHFDLTKSQMLKLYEKIVLDSDIASNYSKEIIDRVYDVLRFQAHKYSYMFK